MVLDLCLLKRADLKIPINVLILINSSLYLFKMLGWSIINHIKRLTISSHNIYQTSIRAVNTTNVTTFRLTDRLDAEPTKKKKRIDPAIIKAREERRRKKLEKQIRRLEKNARQLKPLEELEIPFDLLDQHGKRKRPEVVLSAEESEQRAILQKAWAQYKREEYIADVAQIDRIVSAQRRALDELYAESEELYDEAITLDLQLVPFKTKGPLATPPIKNYESPDGEYHDISKKWQN